KAEEHLSFAQAPDLVVAWFAHLGDELGFPGIAEGGARLAERLVGERGGLAGAGLDDDLDPGPGEPGHDLRHERDPPLASRGLLRHADLHASRTLERWGSRSIGSTHHSDGGGNSPVALNLEVCGEPCRTLGRDRSA